MSQQWGEATKPKSQEEINMKNTLSKGSHIINSYRSNKEAYPYSGEKNHCSKLKEYQVRQIRYWYNHGYCTKHELACLFNVSKSTINDVIRYRTWSHISPDKIITATKFLVVEGQSRTPKAVTLVNAITALNETKLIDIIYDETSLLMKYPSAIILGE